MRVAAPRGATGWHPQMGARLHWATASGNGATARDNRHWRELARSHNPTSDAARTNATIAISSGERTAVAPASPSILTNAASFQEAAPPTDRSGCGHRRKSTPQPISSSERPNEYTSAEGRLPEGLNTSGAAYRPSPTGTPKSSHCRVHHIAANSLMKPMKHMMGAPPCQSGESLGSPLQLLRLTVAADAAMATVR